MTADFEYFKCRDCKSIWPQLQEEDFAQCPDCGGFDFDEVTVSEYTEYRDAKT